jgi:hypothetical protein
MSVIEHRPDHVTVPVCQHEGCPLYGMGAGATCEPDHVAFVEYVPADQLTGAVEALREIDRLLVEATVELPDQRAVTIERAIAIARQHAGGQ